MKTEDIVAEVSSLLEFIEETCAKVGLEHDKFQVALSNTLRLLSESKSTLTKMKGNVEDLKAYVIRTSTELRQTSLAPYETLRTRVESIRSLIQTT